VPSLSHILNEQFAAPGQNLAQVGGEDRGIETQATASTD
jgi:hypothetical protein